MADPFVAEIRIYPFNFAPNGWAFCDGQLLPLSQNTALFSLLGTTYGGNGKSNFALPNLQGNAPMFWGQGPGLSLRDIGETGGSETVTLLESEIPSHSHQLRGSNALGDTPNPGGNTLARYTSNAYQQTTNANLVALSPQALPPAGGDAPHNNLQPYLTFNFCIALQGGVSAADLNPLEPVELRAAGDGDRDFLASVYASSRADELAPVPWSEADKAAFLRAQFEAQDRYYRENYRDTSYDVVLVSGRPAGRLYVARWADEIRLVDIALLPEYRGRGIGSGLLIDVLDEGRRRGVPVRIHVEVFNPARRLYERLGFVASADRGVYVLMECAPAARESA